MPVGTIDPEAYERKELKTLEGAFIMVRPLPYGMVLKRRDKASKMYMEANPGKSKKQAATELARFEIETMNEWATLYDWKYCIGDHNITDKNENKLDFSSPMTMQSLDPKLGAEIDSILSDLNDLEEDEDFTTPLSGTSPDERNGSKNLSLAEDLEKVEIT